MKSNQNSSMLRAVLGLGLGLLSSTPLAAAGDAKAIYKRTCTYCHQAGVNGAPKSFDKAAWAERLEKGMDALVLSVKNGVRNGTRVMPPKGLCNDCSDTDYKAVIEYMSQ